MNQTYNKRLTIDAELDWYEQKFNSIKEYLNNVELATLEDRIHWRQTKTGQMPMLTASKEAQSKNFMDLMEKLPKIFNQLDELRNKYAEKQMIGRGDIETENTAMEFLSKV